MTALPGRRRRSTLIASVAAATAVVVAIALAALGAVTLYNSTEGADAASGIPELNFPSTPTGAIAAVDETGALASVAVLVAQPSGSGGSIVTVPVSADASNGKGDERLPIGETVALRGVEALEPELEAMLGLGLDTVEVVDAARLTAMLESVGPVEVDLPTDVTRNGGDVVAEAGTTTLDPASAAAVLTARDPAIPAAEQYPASTSVWSAIASAMSETGDGTGPGVAAASTATTSDSLLAALASGSVGARGLRADPMDATLNPRGVDVSLLDVSELALVFAQIAPGKTSAPNPALTMRIEANFSDEQLAAHGLSNDEVAYSAISSVLFVNANVLSVNTDAGDAGDVTVVEIADETLEDSTDGVDQLFGPTDVRVAESRIVGVDAVLRLGTEYLDFLATDGQADAAAEAAGEQATDG